MQTQITQITRHYPYEQDAKNMLKRTKKQLEERRIELIDILRWEDDGGRFVTAKKTETLFNDPR